MTVKAGKVEIDRTKLAAFRKQLEEMGIQSPKIQFVARNAPFKRRAAIPPTDLRAVGGGS